MAYFIDEEILISYVGMHLIVYTHLHTYAHTHFLKYFFSLSLYDSNLACMGIKTHIREFLSSVYAEFFMEKLSQEQNVLSF